MFIFGIVNMYIYKHTQLYSYFSKLTEVVYYLLCKYLALPIQKRILGKPFTDSEQ